jgi:hypothetical protein
MLPSFETPAFGGLLGMRAEGLDSLPCWQQEQAGLAAAETIYGSERL